MFGVDELVVELREGGRSEGELGKVEKPMTRQIKMNKRQQQPPAELSSFDLRVFRRVLYDIVLRRTMDHGTPKNTAL